LLKSEIANILTIAQDKHEKKNADSDHGGDSDNEKKGGISDTAQN